MSFESMPEMKDIEREDKLSMVKFWYSRFNFLNALNGIRPGRVSYLLGTTGTGKTTLAGSIIADSAKDSSVLVVLSEENVLRYAKGIYKASPQVSKDNIKFISEKNIPEALRQDQKKILAWLEMHIIESGVRLVFWDNLTSSPLFALKFGPSGQEWAVIKIREICERLQVSFFIVLHTAKGINDNMNRFIEGEDVRGTQQSFISADFFYIFQRFSTGKTFYPFIRTVKHRGCDPKDKIHLLYFGNGIYVKDSPSSFEEMNEVFLKRNVLGKSMAQKKPESTQRAQW